MGLFKEITWHPESATIDVGPGLLWSDIYKFFDDHKIDYNVNGATSCQGVGVAFGPDVTRRWCVANQITGIIRSHEVRQGE